MTDKTNNSANQSPLREEDYKIYDIMAKLLNVPKKEILKSIDLFSNINPDLEKCFSRLYEIKDKDYKTFLMILNYYLFPRSMKFIKKMTLDIKFVVLEREVNHFRETLNTISGILEEMMKHNSLEIEYNNTKNHKELLNIMIHLLAIDTPLSEVKKKIKKLIK